ncbi:uncharacterized protein LOC110240488 isoform X1 [Exaiptasia diaphana]|uniref:Uncharacterized protein n=1 Tax=Exaiptasia diaphana TaxID=2652724 RepID=A0A913XBC9_EXADI|nr:uncharacterized protein LOC110240488 isoform X1 [Exaiptasia diaphana]KXJ13301.1 hypothetical protein AC249_AIPGENE18859 [Exaiptasia diaphana]
MAAASARCVRSLLKSSCTLGRAASSTNTLIKGRQISSLVLRSSTAAFKDSGLLQKIARDAMAKNLARRHTRLSTAVSLIANPIPAVIINSESDGDSVDGLLLDDDETFSCLDDEAIHNEL